MSKEHTSTDVSIIDSLPLPSTLDLPSHGCLPSLTPNTEILNPLPPPMPFVDPYETQYGPTSPSEPQLDSSSVVPPLSTDGELPKFDEVNEQYDFLRRTLSHSRRRYSARYKRPRPKPQKENENESQSSLDQPGQKRDDPYRIRPPDGKRPHPLVKHHTVRGANEYQQRRRVQQGAAVDRRSTPPTVRSTHIDNLGRTYILDHDTHTVQYDTPLEGSDNIPDHRGRREMLNRRYESLQRSFRSAHHQRRMNTINHLSPGESAGAISYLPGDSGSNSLGSENHSTATPHRNKKEQKSDKKSRWGFSLGRRNRSIPQSSSVVASSPTTPQDNIIPIVTSPDILSPITPPPSLDELGISLPPPLPNPLATHEHSRASIEPEMVVGSLEQEQSEENRSEGVLTERNENQDSVTVTAILDAINTTSTQPHPLSSDNDENVATSPVHRVTDLDKAKAVQAQKNLTRRKTSQQESERDHSGDTDEETDIRPPKRTSVSSPDATQDRQEPRVTTPPVTTPPSGIEKTIKEDESQQESADKTQQLEEEDPDEIKESEGFKRQVSSGSRKKLSKGLSQSPALKFITRPDLYTFLSSSGEPGEIFFSNKALVELVQRIRGQTLLFEKYQHSRHLVKALNAFADMDQDLPEGWEKKLNKQGRVFFIDHVNRITTFIDPRLPLNNGVMAKKTTPLQVPQSVRRVYSVSDEPEIRPHHSTIVQTMSLPAETPTVADSSAIQTEEQASYEMQIVGFLRQPDAVEKINQRYRRGVRPNLAEAIEDIRQNGVPGLERIQLAGGTAAYELGLILSMFDEEVNAISAAQANATAPQITVNPPQNTSENTSTAAPSGSGTSNSGNDSSTLQRQKQAFSAKLQTFKLQLARLGFAQSSRLKFNLRRDHLLEDSYEHIMKSEIRHLQRKRLNITFKGEEGLDYGGPSREFFFLVSREIFNPYFGLFEYSANDTYTVQISSTSCFIRNNLDWFRFAGRIIGLVIAQGFLLDVFFTRPFYKLLLKRSPTLKDLESLEPAFFNSLLWIKENDPAPLDLTFTVEEEAFGQLTTHELKEGGTDIPVLEENKKEYIDLMVKWRLDRGTQEQGAALMKGFNEIMPVSLIQQFDAQEIEFIIAGTLEIDIDDWRTHTDYRNGYHAKHPVIIWFWKAIEMFDNEQRLRLLQFITGTSSVPYEGFKALRGSSGPKRFTIDYFNDVRSLPRSHTCFNRLDLPPYPSFEILYEKLRVAFEEGGTFGIE